jgi:hypothetical protein
MPKGQQRKKEAKKPKQQRKPTPVPATPFSFPPTTKK